MNLFKFFINWKNFFFLKTNLTHAKYSSTLSCLFCISEFLLTLNKIRSWISHKTFSIYIWYNTSKCRKCPGEVFWWIVTPEKTFRVTVIHLVEIRLARDLCYSSTFSRLWKSRRCWFVSGNKPLKESSLKIQVGFMSLDSSFDCYSDFMYIFGMSNKPGIWIEITLIKCKYLLFVHCTCCLINWTSLTWSYLIFKGYNSKSDSCNRRYIPSQFPAWQTPPTEVQICCTLKQHCLH